MKTIFLYIFIVLFSAVACQPIEYSSLQTSFLKAPKDTPSSADSSAKPFAYPVFARSSQKKFKDQFASDKLDLVFVLDTSPAMSSFYAQNRLGPHFLQKLENYDWKFAYTDMSVDMEELVEQSEDKEEESCDFFAGLFMTGAGLFLGGGVSFGLSKLYDCASSIEIGSETKEFSNGNFLPFEYDGTQVKPETFHQLTPAVQKYNTIFDHSLRLENAENSSYSAPIQRDSQAYPFLSMAFSIAKNGVSYSNQTKPASSFFRKDSSIIYVLITVQDVQIDISSEQFNQSLETFFGSKNRVRLIPVTLGPNSPIFCNLKLQKGITDSPKLRKLSRSLGSNSLDICSQNLAEELFTEISKSLYPTGFLGE